MRRAGQHGGGTGRLCIDNDHFTGHDAISGRIGAGLGKIQSFLGDHLAVDHDVVAHALIRRNGYRRRVVIEIRTFGSHCLGKNMSPRGEDFVGFCILGNDRHFLTLRTRM